MIYADDQTDLTKSKNDFNNFVKLLNCKNLDCCFIISYRSFCAKDKVLFYCLLQEKRLRDRQTETEESIQKRLEAARVDMELSKYLCSSART